MHSLHRTKGQSEDGIEAAGIKNIAIMRPGLLIGRRNDWRCEESLLEWCPCVAKCPAADQGFVMFEHAIKNCNGIIGKQIFLNADI